MAALNHFEDFVEALGLGEHNLSTGVIKLALSNTAPTATDTDFAPGGAHPAPAAANGYATADITNVWAESGGTGTLTATDTVFTASGGDIGPFRYVIMYNDTHSTDGLIGWYDNTSSITLNDTETFTVNFGASVFTITTA